MGLSPEYVRVLQAIADGTFDPRTGAVPRGTLTHLVWHGLIKKPLPWSQYSLTGSGRRQLDKALRGE